METTTIPLPNDVSAFRTPGILLERVTDYYQRALSDSDEALHCLERMGIRDRDMLVHLKVGYSDGNILDILPEDDSVLRRLRECGVLDNANAERFSKCIILPLMGLDGEILALAGWHVDDRRFVPPVSCATVLWNIPAIITFPDIYLCNGIIDALSLISAGCANTVAQLADSMREADVAAITNSGTRSATLIDLPNTESVIRRKLPGVSIGRKRLPEERSLNSFLVQYGPERLREAIESAPLLHLHDDPVSPPTTPPHPTGGMVTYCGNRMYDLRSIEKTTTRLKVTLRTELGSRLHVDTVDLYSAKARRALSADLCRFYCETPEIIEADIARIIRLAETAPPTQNSNTKHETPQVTMTDEERAEAREFGRCPDLIERILADYEACGLVGERNNKLVCYLAAISRKMPEPLSVLILSSSGAGKTALQDTTLRFCPSEHIVKLTSITGKALFYKGPQALKHKVLAIEEVSGAQDADYAIRCLISSGELLVESTVKDLSTGKLTTTANRVEGPTAVFITTTDPDVNPETRSRFLILSVDESREQTRAILESQRRKHTLDGLTVTPTANGIVRTHHNFQRLLKPIPVVNPFVERAVSGDDRLQNRRDQPKHLNLIRAVAFLRQMQKSVKVTSGVSYVEADEEDLRVASMLLMETSSRRLDDLNGVSRNLLSHLEKLAAERLERVRENGNEKGYICDVRFTRREIREFTGWAHARVERYLKQLVDLEYVVVERGRNGVRYVYRLASQSAEPSHLLSTFSPPSQSTASVQHVAPRGVAQPSQSTAKKDIGALQ